MIRNGLGIGHVSVHPSGAFCLLLMIIHFHPCLQFIANVEERAEGSWIHKRGKECVAKKEAYFRFSENGFTQGGFNRGVMLYRRVTHSCQNF